MSESEGGLEEDGCRSEKRRESLGQVHGEFKKSG